jgi:DNA-binding XRE family transcriptional regulator
MARRSKVIRLAGVKPLIRTQVEVSWSDGTSDRVDLGPHLKTYSVYKDVLSTRRFRRIHVDEYGYALTWGGDAEVAITTLERLVREQAPRMTSAVFKRWRMDRGIDQAEAARLLGLSRRTIIGYETGKQSIPRSVCLATLYLDTVLSNETRRAA